MESFCHVGGRHGNHPNYGQNCVVLAPFEDITGHVISPRNCCQCGKSTLGDTTGPVARPQEPKEKGPRFEALSGGKTKDLDRSAGDEELRAGQFIPDP